MYRRQGLEPIVVQKPKFVYRRRLKLHFQDGKWMRVIELSRSVYCGGVGTIVRKSSQEHDLVIFRAIEG